MMYIFNGNSDHEAGRGADSAPSYQKREKPKDWAYMEQSGRVLRDLPETWKAYAQDEAGRMAIIKMEYAELMKAQTPEEISHELVHLGSATLHLWRLLNNAE